MKRPETEPLDRFLEAQDAVFADVCAELRSGRKQSHWIWFIFPQISGLGSSPLARHYAIASLDEARAYLAHPVLSPRLTLVTELMIAHSGHSLTDILGTPDDMKFLSSMTLFDAASRPLRQGNLFSRALQIFNAGRRDEKTLAIIGAH